MEPLRRLILFAIAVFLCGIVWASAQTPEPDASASPSPDASASPSPSPEEKPPDPVDQQMEEVSNVGANAINAIENTVTNVATKLTRSEGEANAVSGWFSTVIHLDILGFSIGQLALSFLVLLITMSIRRVLTQFIFRRLHALVTKTKWKYDDQLVGALEKPASALLLIIGIFLAIAILPLEPAVRGFFTYLFRAATLLTFVWAAVRVTDVFGNILENTVQQRQDSAFAGFIPLIRKTLKIFVLIVGVLMAIDNLGYNVAGIIATLGLGTAAIALASQDTLKNGFGALMIMLDRPFKIGDWIQVGDQVDGTVESIGLRSTKVRTFPKTLLSIPNGVLANDYVNNWSRMPKRRVKQTVGVTYDATADDMDGIVEDIRRILREDEAVDQDFILVNFTDFGESSLDILVYYFTRTINWLEYMDVRQRINCQIMRAVESRGLSIAFPTRTVHLVQDTGPFDGIPASSDGPA